MKHNTLYKELRAFLDTLPIFSTHEHHQEDEFFTDMSLDKIFTNSYVDWCNVPFDETPESRAEFLSKVRHNSYFVWLYKGLQELYDFEEKLTADNWDELSNRIRVAHQQPDYHLDILRERCCYEAVVQDTYWQPGSDLGHPDLFNRIFVLTCCYSAITKRLSTTTETTRYAGII